MIRDQLLFTLAPNLPEMSSFARDVWKKDRDQFPEALGEETYDDQCIFGFVTPAADRRGERDKNS